MKVGDIKYVWGVWKCEVIKIYPDHPKYGQRIEIGNKNTREDYAPELRGTLVTASMLHDEQEKHIFPEKRESVKL